VTGICLRLQVHQQLREELAKVKTLEGVAAVSQALKLRCQAGAGLVHGNPASSVVGQQFRSLTGLGLLQEDMSRQQEGVRPADNLPAFHWICQPYIRPG
jgi:tRNA-dihydrouridine synthase 1